MVILKSQRERVISALALRDWSPETKLPSQLVAAQICDVLLRLFSEPTCLVLVDS